MKEEDTWDWKALLMKIGIPHGSWGKGKRYPVRNSLLVICTLLTDSICTQQCLQLGTGLQNWPGNHTGGCLWVVRCQLQCTRWRREGKWRGNWKMQWVASTLHTTSENGVSSITTADAYTSAASSRLNWRPRLFKWTRPFRRKTKSCFCACAITF